MSTRKRKSVGESTANRTKRDSKTASKKQKTEDPNTQYLNEVRGEEFFTAEKKGKLKKKVDTPQQQQQQEQQEEEEEDENVEEKKIRLAKKYLEKLATLDQLEKEGDSSGSGGDNDEDEEQQDDRISSKLQNEAFSLKFGRSYKFLNIADQISAAFTQHVETYKTLKIHHGQQLPVTCIALDEQHNVFYSTSKDQTIVKWDVTSMKKLHTIKGFQKDKNQEDGHKGNVCLVVLAVAVSADGAMIATGGVDKKIKIWDTNTFGLLETFTGHRDTVSALAFRLGTHTLYSGSFDRSVKLWNCDTHAYVETLYGHTAPIHAIDALRKERCTTVSFDKSVRQWKIADQTQLVFTGGGGESLDCFVMISEDTWLSGSQDGTIALWKSIKKKPVCLIKQAHGTEESDNRKPYWVCSLAAIPYSDFFASGSNSGFIKLWKIEKDKEITHIGDIPMQGWVNALKISNSGKYIIAGVGKDHRMGRWCSIPHAKNGVCKIPLL